MGWYLIDVESLVTSTLLAEPQGSGSKDQCSRGVNPRMFWL